MKILHNKENEHNVFDILEIKPKSLYMLTWFPLLGIGQELVLKSIQ